MKKQEFYFYFPKVRETIIKKMNPLTIKDAVTRYLNEQYLIRGNICIVTDAIDGDVEECNVLAIGYLGKQRVQFFTEDESVSDIISIDEYKEGNNNE